MKILPFILYPILILLLFFLSPTTLNLSALGLFFFGILFWNIYEYSFHRFAFHNLKMSKKWKRYLAHGHRFHHRYPDKTDDLVLPLIITIPFSLGSVLITLLLFGTGNLGFYYLGLILSMFNYEFMHYAAHHLKINNVYFKWMKRYHLLHHHKTPNSRFMVSNPLFDYLFRSQS